MSRDTPLPGTHYPHYPQPAPLCFAVHFVILREIFRGGFYVYGSFWVLGVPQSIGVEGIGSQVHADWVGRGDRVPVKRGSVAGVSGIIGEKLHRLSRVHSASISSGIVCDPAGLNP